MTAKELRALWDERDSRYSRSDYIRTAEHVIDIVRGWRVGEAQLLPVRDANLEREAYAWNPPPRLR